MAKQMNNGRNSSVELFRIVAAFMVMILHYTAYFMEIGGTLNINSPIDVNLIFIQSLSFPAVDCFLMITGWYGLKFRWQHVWTIWITLVWIYIPFYIFDLAIGMESFHISSVIMKITAFGHQHYYIHCYMMLLFLSPVINCFIEKYGKKILPFTLAYWGIEVVYDWILNKDNLGFELGYGITHFVFMYLLGRTLYLYQDKIRHLITTWRVLGAYILGGVILTAENIILPWDITFAYSNPVIVMMAALLFLLFEKKTFHNRAINIMGKSVLAVYIGHTTWPFHEWLRDYSIYTFDTYPFYVFLLLMMVTNVVVFVGLELYDKIRILIFSRYSKRVGMWLTAKTQKFMALTE